MESKYQDALAATKKSSYGETSSKRDHLLVMRLSVKEQELQELSNQVTELKAAQVPSTSQLRSTLVDPGVNEVLRQLQRELAEAKKKQQETQEELNAWKFTPDSVAGKRLMSKCRQLLQENEEIGKMISSGRLAKLEGELTMQKALCEEMKKNQLEMDEFVQELDEDVEGMQSTVYFLQQQLKEAKERIRELEDGRDKDKSEDASAKSPSEGAPDEKAERESPEPESIQEQEEGKDDEEDAAEKEEEEEGEEEKAETPSRGRGRTRAAQAEAPAASPGSRRSTRGQKREAGTPPPPSSAKSKASSSPASRPKRRRAAPQRFSTSSGGGGEGEELAADDMGEEEELQA